MPANQSAAANAQPFAEMNTTPLIDVLLVLLIMFIITIPVATNSVEVDMPSDGVVVTEPNPIKNKVVITVRDQTLWNGRTVSDSELAALLAKTRKFTTEPELQYEPSASASYDRSLRVLNIIKASGVTRFGFVGNDRYAAFDTAS